jgi:poly(3-hydroxybutyrate) depolymerase
LLYQLHETQRALLNPASFWAESMSKLYGNPYSPWAFSPLANRVSAGFELMYRLGKEYEKPAFGLTTTKIGDQEVSVSERIELSKPFCQLRKFERLLPRHLAKHENDPTVLIFAPLSGHHSTLLRDTVKAMLPDHNVYITDWVDARMVPLEAGPFHLDDYIAYSIEFMRHLASQIGPNLHVVSVCQPTVPVLAAISIMATLKDKSLPKTMTLMGGPIDPTASPTEVNDLATTRSFSWFENTVICKVPQKYQGAGRKVYPGFLQHAGFVAMNRDRHVKSHYDFYLDLVRGDMQDVEAHRKFYDEYNAVLDLPAEYYLDTIKTVFQEHRLPKGTWDVKFEGNTIRVAPQDIKTVALLTIEGELDDISGSGQTEAAQWLCSGIAAKNKKHFTAEQCGHYGIFSGRRWREIIYPQLFDFIRRK